MRRMNIAIRPISILGIGFSLLNYAAYEYCDTPNLAAEIHTIWNTLLFNPIEDDNALSMQLKTLSDAMKNGE